MVKAVVFDIGNVLMDFGWKAYLEKQWPDDPAMREELANATFLSEEWQEGDRRDMTAEEWTVRYIKNAPHLEKEIRQICTHLRDIFSVYPYTRSWIRTMKKMGYRVYYLSNYARTAFEQTEDILDFTEEMDGGLFSCDVHMVKPDPAFFRLLLEKYQLDPARCVFIDDIETNLEGARAVGMHIILFENPAQAEAQLDRVLGNEG